MFGKDKTTNPCHWSGFVFYCRAVTARFVWHGSFLAMTTFDKFDALLIGAVDRVTGNLETRDVRLPVVLRELILAEMAIGATLPVAAIAGGYGITAALWAIVMSVILPRRYARWKVLDRDAKAEWTETLSRRYFSRAEANRRNNTPRLMGWFFVSLAAVGTWLSYAVDLLAASDMLLVGLFAAELTRMYFECAIPTPPGDRFRMRAPAPV